MKKIIIKLEFSDTHYEPPALNWVSFSRPPLPGYYDCVVFFFFFFFFFFSFFSLTLPFLFLRILVANNA